MSVGQAVREARAILGLRQADVAARTYLSREMVAKVEQGRRRIAPELQPVVARELDDPRLYMELAAEATGGVAPVYLDGERVDLHRASCRDKVVEELSEAIRALTEAKALVNARNPHDLDDDGRQQIGEVLHQLVEAETACANMVAVLCRTYRISPRSVYEAHRRELAAKGYIARHGESRRRCNTDGSEQRSRLR